MKPSRIIPAAAGVIALTATIAFAQDYNPNDETESLRIRVSERKLNAGTDANEKVPLASLAIDSESGTVYQVEITRGDTSKVVLIEAETGKIIRNLPIPDGKAT